MQLQKRCALQARVDVQHIGCRLNLQTWASLTTKKPHTQSRSVI